MKQWIKDGVVITDVAAYEGQVVSNPTEEWLTAHGWEEYIAPKEEPRPKEEPSYVEVVAKLKALVADEVSALPDDKASEVAELFPSWASCIGVSLEVGAKYYYDGRLYKVIKQHVAQSDWTPSAAASLFQPVGSPSEQGTKESPIAWVSGMAAEQGKYYTDDSGLYECIRDSGGVGLYYDLTTLASIQYMQKTT